MGRYRFRDKVDPLIDKLKKLSADDQIWVLSKALEVFSRDTTQTTFESDGDEATLESAESERVRTLEDLVKVANIDLIKWYVDRYITNAWEVTSWKKGYPETRTNHQVKAWLKPNQPAIDQDFLRKEIFKELNQKSPVIKFKHDNKEKGGVKLEINIHDLHLGKLAWKEEVGVDYNIKIAYQLYKNTIQKIIQRALDFNLNIEEIILVTGSDFYNVDSMFDETTKGTPQDEDTRWQKTFRMGVKLVKEEIYNLQEIAPVRVVVVQGNHDKQRSYYLGECLYQHFENNENVYVDNSPKKHKIYQFGNCAIMWTHGDKVSDRSWTQIFAVEFPDEWSNSKYKEIHSGDKHHKAKKNQDVIVNDGDKVREFKGATFRITRALTTIDDYHYASGYVGTLRGAEAFIWKQDEGLIGTIDINL